MKIIGCDFHPGYQQIAVLDLATGEIDGWWNGNGPIERFEQHTCGHREKISG